MILKVIKNIAVNIRPNKIIGNLSCTSFYKFSDKNDGPKGFNKFQRNKNNPKNPTPTPKQEEQKIAPKVKKEPEPEQKDEEADSIPDQNKENKKEQKPNSFFNFWKNKEEEQKKQDQDFNKDQFKTQANTLKLESIKYFKQNYKIFFGLALLSGGKLCYDYYKSQETTSYKELVDNYLENNLVQKITIQRVLDGHQITALVLLTDNHVLRLQIQNVDNFLFNLEQIQISKGQDTFIPIEFVYKTDLNKVYFTVESLMTLAIWGFMVFSLYRFAKSAVNQATKGGGGGTDIFGIGKSNAKVFNVETSLKIRFNDVAGLDEAKQEIQEFVDFLKKPQKYKDIGAKIPKGALLAGPPGTGKTLMAKACAGEAGVPFFYISGSDFVEMFVGVGASRVRDLFKNAKSKSPSIIFIDEIDAVGRKRESKGGGNDERDNTLNQLLVEMDGFGTDSQVIILAATNRKELLDPALTRPGRFDRTIEIDLPDIDGRKQIFMVHLKTLKLDTSKTMEEYAKRLSTLTPGFSGADIANLCNEAAILAARKNKNCIETIDFEMASERVLAGLEKKRIVSEMDRKIVAVHECGHAIVSWFLEGGAPLLKLTIIPRSKGSLGFAQYLPNESQIESKQDLLDRLCSILGGRCAEQAFFGKITTGAYDDLKKAYELVHAMVTRFGMSQKIGNIGFSDTQYNKSYSSNTNKIIDDEIKNIIQEATERTMLMVNQYKDQIQNLSDRLLEKETLDLRQIKEVLGERPFAPRSNFKAYLETQELTKQEVIEQGKNEAKLEEDRKASENQTKTIDACF